MIDDKALSDAQIQKLENARLKALKEYDVNEEEVLGRARENIGLWHGYFSHNFRQGKEDLNFLLKSQWSHTEKADFYRLKKPALTFNKLYDAVKKILGEQRKNKPDLMVRSLTGRASQEDIDLRADLLRTIAYASQNDLVYQNAFLNSLGMGFGAFRVAIEYENERSFDQVVRYKLILDPTRCLFDPNAKMPHKGDGNYCGEYSSLSREEFDATYPHIVDPISYQDARIDVFNWGKKDVVVIFDYYEKEWFPSSIYKLSDGRVVTKDQWREMQKEINYKEELAKDPTIGDLIAREIPYIVMERITEDYRIMHYRLTRDAIVEVSEWPSKYLPLIFVDGNSYYLDGKQYTRSFIHDAKDAQKFINYTGSEIAGEVKNRRREQWVVTVDNIQGYEQEWRNPEIQVGALRAKPDPKTGQMPQKMPAWEISPSLLQNFQRGSQDIREILGFSETEQLQGRDISGSARRERKLEASMSSYIYFDNLNHAVAQAGRCVLDLFPVIYSNERSVILTKQDGKTKSIKLNNKNNERLENAITAGDYDIELDTGPSFAVQKDIALEFLQQTLQNQPQIFPYVADVWIEQLDIQSMIKLRDRIQKYIVPPDVMADENGEPPPQPKPDPQQLMMQQQMQLAQAQIQEKQAKVQNEMKKIELQAQALELDKAELLLKAQDIDNQAQLDVYNHQADIQRSRIAHGLDHQKQHLDYQARIAKILADVSKQ